MFKEQVKRILKKVKSLDLELAPTLSLKYLKEVEEKTGINFPESYVIYLTQIQNGGALDETLSMEDIVIAEKKLDIEVQKNCQDYYNYCELRKRKYIKAIQLHTNIMQKRVIGQHLPMEVDINAYSPKPLPNVNCNMFSDGIGPYYGILPFETSLVLNTIHTAVMDKPFFITEDVEEFDEFKKKYFKKRQLVRSIINGTLYICNYGCGDFFRLILNGPKRGQLLVENIMASKRGLYFLNVDILTFYENWLNNEEAILQGKKEGFVNAEYGFLEFGKNNKYKVIERSKG